MTRYAEGTSVPVSKSREEIERIVSRFGCDAFASGFEGDKAMVQFRSRGKYVRFVLNKPPLDDFPSYENGRHKSLQQREKAQEGEWMRRWRSLALNIKAKLDSVESEISSFEEEFAMHFVLPDNSTVADHVLPAVEQAYATGQMPSLLPQLEAPKPTDVVEDAEVVG